MHTSLHPPPTTHHALTHRHPLITHCPPTHPPTHHLPSTIHQSLSIHQYPLSPTIICCDPPAIHHPPSSCTIHSSTSSTHIIHLPLSTLSTHMVHLHHPPSSHTIRSSTSSTLIDHSPITHHHPPISSIYSIHPLSTIIHPTFFIHSSPPILSSTITHPSTYHPSIHHPHTIIHPPSSIPPSIPPSIHYPSAILLLRARFTWLNTCHRVGTEYCLIAGRSKQLVQMSKVSFVLLRSKGKQDN